MLPPTAHLPPIKQLDSLLNEESEHILHDHLNYLRFIYNPPVRGARRRGRHIISTAEQTELDSLRSDAFEQSYALRWLSALMRAAHNNGTGGSLIDSAAALLASCSGTSGAGVLIRDFVFSSSHFPNNISVLLTDRPLDNSDFRSVGSQTWGGACVLAEEIMQRPVAFFRERNSGPSIPFRILELGAGTGLVSLVAAKVCEALLPSVEIVATDYYPSVLKNLASNVEANFPSSVAPSNTKILTHTLDWEAFAATYPSNHPAPPFSEPFDLVLGADIVYGPLHAQWICGCLRRLLRKPSGGVTPTFHLMVPLRPTFAKESETMDVVFPFASDVKKTGDGKEDDLELVTLSKEVVLCDVAVSPAAEEEDSEEDDCLVKYAYYIIGWGLRR
ncbi:hypothetical protein L218DRAFT_852518 [Marasmius fiardii PR-910]|nr:hypothetical protein L218DRAFT_852518 [Marasmius fiardii PR-910]